MTFEKAEVTRIEMDEEDIIVTSGCTNQVSRNHDKFSDCDNGGHKGYQGCDHGMTKGNG